jgi:hypothetical protein
MPDPTDTNPPPAADANPTRLVASELRVVKAHVRMLQTIIEVNAEQAMAAKEWFEVLEMLRQTIRRQGGPR